MGGMIYGRGGEKKHRSLFEEKSFKWKELLEVLKEFEITGWLTIETPDTGKSAVLAKEFYDGL